MSSSMYTAVRLNREPGRDAFDTHFTVVWETATELKDPSELFRIVTAQNSEVWGLWPTKIRPGWRTLVDRQAPAFLLTKHLSGEALMLSDGHAGEIRELSFSQEEDG